MFVHHENEKNNSIATWRSSDWKVFVNEHSLVTRHVTGRTKVRIESTDTFYYTMVLLFSKIVRWGYMINASMTTTFECTFLQLKPDLVDQKYKSLCDSSTQNMLYMLSTLSAGPSCAIRLLL